MAYRSRRPHQLRTAVNNSTFEVEEFEARVIRGFVALLGQVISLVLMLICFGASAKTPIMVLPGVLLSVAFGLAFFGHFVIQPNQSMVIIVFGRYKGTAKKDGWWWTNPFSAGSRKKISMRIHNFTTDTSKINDAIGNPIEIAAVVVWRVEDTAKATFRVEDYRDYVYIQSDTAIRYLGTEYSYDTYDDNPETLSLRGNPEEVSVTLHRELQERLDDAGIVVLEARLTHLAYAQEIAEAMLRRQQAAAVVAARRTIVEGAVGMVDDALQKLAEENIIDMDDERKAAMVSNLLVVLTSESQTQPVVNAGSLY